VKKKDLIQALNADLAGELQAVVMYVETANLPRGW